VKRVDEENGIVQEIRDPFNSLKRKSIESDDDFASGSLSTLRLPPISSITANLSTSSSVSIPPLAILDQFLKRGGGVIE
jgi:hypothetical protein